MKLTALGVCALAGLGVCSQADTCTREWQIYEFIVVSISIYQTGFVSCKRINLWACWILYIVSRILGPRFVQCPRSHPIRLQVIFRLFESILVGITLHLLVRAQTEFGQWWCVDLRYWDGRWCSRATKASEFRTVHHLHFRRKRGS